MERFLVVNIGWILAKITILIFKHLRKENAEM